MKRSLQTTRGLEGEAVLLLKDALRPSASVRVSDRDAGEDAVIQLQGGQQIPVRFLAWSRSEANPTHDAGRIWILPRATNSLREQLRRRGESFVDLSGAVYLIFPNLLVDRTGLTLPTRQKAVHRSFDPFADRSSLVVRTLLETQGAPERAWGVRELAQVAGVGPATVTRAVRELQRYGAIDVRRSGRDSAIRLMDARALFTLWTGAYDWTKNQSLAVHAPIGDPIRFLHRSQSLFGQQRWALTLQAGASLIAPHATWERVHLYLEVENTDELLELADRQEWPAAEEGRLVLMKPYYRDSVWHGLQLVEDLPIVSSLQLALDLWHYPLRGREQAEHIISIQRLVG